MFITLVEVLVWELHVVVKKKDQELGYFGQ